jgi:hypothetical protein
VVVEGRESTTMVVEVVVEVLLLSLQPTKQLEQHLLLSAQEIMEAIIMARAETHTLEMFMH